MKKFLLGALSAILLFGMVLSSIFYTAPAEIVSAAPALAPTPVAGVTRGSKGGQLANFYATRVITADQVSTCLETLGFDLMDAHFWVDQGGPSNNNTTTLTLLYTNDKAIATSLYDVGPVIVTANAIDAADMVQLPVFGRYTCVDVNVTNARAITLSLKTVVK